MKINDELYIIINGPDGSGKDTQVALLLEKYPSVILVREPGGTPEADIIREVILNPESSLEERINKTESVMILPTTTELCKTYLERALSILKIDGLTGEAEMELYAASRAQTNETLVIPAKKEGKFLLGNRSVACSVSYQGVGRGLGVERVWEVNKPALKGALPTIEIFIDVETDVAMERLEKRTEKSDRLDQEGKAFHQKTREGYLTYYREICPYPYVLLDGNRKPQDVHRDILSIVNEYI